MYKYTECKIEKLIEITSMVSAFEYDYPDNYIFKGESHDFWEFMVIKKGNVNVTVDNKVYHLNSNKLIVFRPNEFHSVSNLGEPFSLQIISFNLKNSLTIDNTIFSLDIEERSVFQNMLALAKKIFNFNKYTIKSYKDNCAIELQIFLNKLELFFTALLQRQNNLTCQIENITTINFAKIINIMRNNLDKNLNTKDIANLAQMSPSNVKKTFALFVNEGLINYFNQIKILEAKSLLKQGYSVGTTATKLGFMEQNYFSNVFKKHTGYSPRNWLKCNSLL